MGKSRINRCQELETEFRSGAWAKRFDLWRLLSSCRAPLKLRQTHTHRHTIQECTAIYMYMVVSRCWGIGPPAGILHSGLLFCWPPTFRRQPTGSPRHYRETRLTNPARNTYILSVLCYWTVAECGWRSILLKRLKQRRTHTHGHVIYEYMRPYSTYICLG